MDATQDEITKVIRESGRSRIPVYAKNLDDILGILNAREFLLERGEGGDKLPERLIRPAYFVPETLRAATLFKDMQQKKQHIAVVVDEYGQTSGIVTMEDPVSYTHLDVYKRQGLLRRRRGQEHSRGVHRHHRPR